MKIEFRDYNKRLLPSESLIYRVMMDIVPREGDMVTIMNDITQEQRRKMLYRVKMVMWEIWREMSEEVSVWLIEVGT